MEINRAIILAQAEDLKVCHQVIADKDKVIKELEQQLIDIHHLYQELHDTNLLQ